MKTEILSALNINKVKNNFIVADGCKFGWCVIGIVNNQLIKLVCEKLEEVLEAHPIIEKVYIDIPIGLSSEYFTRNIDQKLRNLLKGKTSSVFTPPCREALSEVDYKASNQMNKKITGKGLSIQAFYISKKIKEIDDLIRSDKINAHFYEAHPELCFKILNNNKVVLSKKSSKDGVLDRITLLQNINPQLFDIYNFFLKEFKRSQVKKDDILDTLAILYCKILSPHDDFLTDSEPTDAAFVEISIYKPQLAGV